MTSIKPPGGPGNVQPPSTPDAAQKPSATGESFQSRLGAQQKTEGAQQAQKPGAAAGASGSAAPQSTQAVIDDLKAGRITPNEAVDKLTDMAVRRSGAPPSARPAVEAQLRELLARDPIVKDLLRQMGAAVADDAK